MTPRENRIEQIVAALVEVGIDHDLAERLVERHRNHSDEMDALWDVLEDYICFVRCEKAGAA